MSKVVEPDAGIATIEKIDVDRPVQGGRASDVQLADAVGRDVKVERPVADQVCRQ